MIFFFQAEDGIRDTSVTGVQTCALPISEDESAPKFTKDFVGWGAGTRAVQYLVLGAKARAAIAGEYNVTCDHVRAVAALRSEERRVGKECRSRWWRRQQRETRRKM